LSMKARTDLATKVKLVMAMQRLILLERRSITTKTQPMAAITAMNQRPHPNCATNSGSPQH